MASLTISFKIVLVSTDMIFMCAVAVKTQAGIEKNSISPIRDRYDQLME